MASLCFSILVFVLFFSPTQPIIIHFSNSSVLSEIIPILRNHNADVLIHHPNHDVLAGFAGQNINLTLAVSDAATRTITSLEAADTWVATYVTPFYETIHALRVADVEGAVAATALLTEALSSAQIAGVAVLASSYEEVPVAPPPYQIPEPRHYVSTRTVMTHAGLAGIIILALVAGGLGALAVEKLFFQRAAAGGDRGWRIGGDGIRGIEMQVRNLFGRLEG